MEEKYKGVLAYLLGIIGPLVVLFGLKDKYAIYLRHKKIGTFNYSKTIMKFKSIYKKI